MSNNGSNNGETPRGQYRGNLSEAEVGWLSGILDGEGTFDLSLHNANGTGFSCARLSIRLATCSFSVAKKAQGIIEKITFKKPNIQRAEPRKGGRYPVFSLAVSDQKSCRKLAETLLPHLTCKKEQAEVVIEFCTARKDTKHSGRNAKYGDTELQIISRFQPARRASYDDVPAGLVETKRSALVN